MTAYQYLDGKFHMVGFAQSLKIWCSMFCWNYDKLDPDVRSKIERYGKMYYHFGNNVVTYQWNEELLTKELREKGIIS